MIRCDAASRGARVWISFIAASIKCGCRLAPRARARRRIANGRPRDGRLICCLSDFSATATVEVRPGPVTILSTGTSRRPFGPATARVARAAISAGTLSAAGDALQRLPASDARPCTWVEPIRLAASTTPGQACCKAWHSPITAPGVDAPMTSRRLARECRRRQGSS